MRLFDPWVGSRYATDGIAGKRLLILGESHYGGDHDLYPAFTSTVIRGEALQKGSFPIFARIQHLVAGGRGALSPQERADFWHRVAFCNFIQAVLKSPRARPTFEMWQAAREPLLQTLQELAPNIVLVLGVELRRNLPPIPEGICICAIPHPSAPRGCGYAKWQPIILSALNATAPV